MNILIVASLGVVIVLTSILWLRLHPLLGLLVGSLFLLAATPERTQLENHIQAHGYPIRGFASGGLVGLESAVPAGTYLIWQSPQAPGDYPEVTLQRASAERIRQASRNNSPLADHLIWYALDGGAVSVTRNDRLISSTQLAELSAARWTGLGGRLADGFAKTFRKLGIPVTMAAIIGVCLLESGAAARLVGAIMALFGTRGTAPALTLSGFVLGVPVYFDNVFYLLLPLAKAVGRQRPEAFVTAVMAIIVGATMAHSLVPPTPGPLFVADQLNVGIGMMMLGGLIVGGSAASVGFAYGTLCNRWIKLAPDSVAEQRGPAQASEPSRKIPLLLAALPIALPIAALGSAEVIETLAKGRPPNSPITQLHSVLAIFKDPTLIFIGAAVFAIAILRRYSSADTVGRSVARGLSDAGTIVLLTCAGGAFGASLQQLQIADAIGQQFAGLTTPWGMLFTAFFLTTIIRGAQGSATVAMLTSSAIIAPVVETIELPFHPVYVALAIGSGSKPLPWMNDSGFWQVATMTGMTTGQTLKTFSVALTLMGLTGFAVTLLGAWLIPLV